MMCSQRVPFPGPRPWARTAQAVGKHDERMRRGQRAQRGHQGAEAALLIHNVRAGDQVRLRAQRRHWAAPGVVHHLSVCGSPWHDHLTWTHHAANATCQAQASRLCVLEADTMAMLVSHKFAVAVLHSSCTQSVHHQNSH